MKVTVTADVSMQCPYADERDKGRVELSFDVLSGDAPELHDLARRIAEFVQLQAEPVSHEAFTRALYGAMGARDIKTYWTTAGMAVVCELGPWG